MYSSDMNNAYIFFGKSGSGKGTQAHLLMTKLESDSKKVLYIETGALIRSFAGTDSYIAGITKKDMEEGGLTPEFLATTFWGQFLISNFTGNESIVLDGVARRLDEAKMLISALKYIGIQNIYVIFINTSNEWSTDRLLARGRSDDDVNEIEKRLEWFAQNTMESLEYFKQNEDVNYIEINGEQSVEQVNADILNSLQKA